MINKQRDEKRRITLSKSSYQKVCEVAKAFNISVEEATALVIEKGLSQLPSDPPQPTQRSLDLENGE